jgi:hypothetical protein
MEEKVIKYVQEKYAKLYKGKTIMVEEFGSTFLIRTQKDESPLILNRSILDEV